VAKTLVLGATATRKPDEHSDDCESDDYRNGQDFLGLGHSWRLFQIAVQLSDAYGAAWMSRCTWGASGV